MLRVTAEQEAAVHASRRAFNLRAVALAANSDAELLGNSAPVDIDAWRRIDTRATTMQRDVLAVFNRMARGSQTPIDVGDLVNYFPQVSDSGEVTVSLDGRQTGRSDQAQVKYVGTPVPVIASEARWGWRQMAVNRKGRIAIDTITIENHQRKVAEKLEDMMLNGDAQVVINGLQIYGLRNHPNRNTGNHTFDLNATATGANWVTAFNSMLQLMVGDNAYSPVTVFLNYSDWLYASINDFSATKGDQTILQRLRAIENIADIVPASKVPADNIIGVAGVDTGNWGTILSAMPMTTRPKNRQNTEDDYVFSTMAIAAPQLRTDFTNQMGVVHLSQ